MGILTAKNIGWFVGYVLVVFFVIFLLNDYRARAISNYNTPEARQNWQKWREAAQASGRHGGVERSQPKSSEPPSLVLMRDHFAACAGISTLLTSCLYVLVHGLCAGCHEAASSACRHYDRFIGIYTVAVS